LLLIVNGKEIDAAGIGTIAELVKQKGLKPDTIVIEHNLTVVAKEAWPETVLRAGDKVEIVTFMGGG
jgi:sulfur carrier protein